MARIAIFDSGLGGLSITKEIRQQLPSLDLIYLGDTARLPYGTKSISTIKNYVTQNISKLLEYDIDAVVIACNSASTVLSAVKDNFNLPIYGVIQAGSKTALSVSENKNIAVIGTRATIQSNAYVTELQSLDTNVQVYSQACPLLVPFVEEGLIDDPITRLIVFRYLQPLQQTPIDTLIMGCTHYPFLKKSFQDVLGSSVNLVDSALGICQQLKDRFKDIPSESHGKVKFLCTDYNEHYKELTDKLWPEEAIEIEKIDL